ncbi:hypothetical protein GCM10028801_02240 [Nocardioides maradonensis]
MRIRFRRTALALAAALALTAGTSAAAGAATWSHGDQAGDVTYGSPPDFTQVHAPDDTRDDIVALQVAHQPRNVTITLTLRGLPPRGHVLQTYLQTPHRRYETFPQGSSTVVLRTDGPRGDCHVPHDTIDSTHFRIRLTIPRSCLGRPRWVRVSALLTEERQVDGTDRIYSDDAIRSDAWPHPLGISPRVRVG